MIWRRDALCCLVLSGWLLLIPVGRATEGATGHTLPGGIATLIDLPPTKAGWVVEPLLLNYQGDTSASTAVPLAGTLASDIAAQSSALLVGGLYTFERRVLGAYFSAGAYLPLVSTKVKATVDTAIGSRRFEDSASGIGDLTLFPAMLAWKKGHWQTDAILSVYAPTGNYQAGRLANQGLNYWTVDPIIGVSYNSPDNGRNAAIHAGIGINSKNQETNYRSGATLHVDASVQQLLPLGVGYLGVGAEAFYFRQVSGDSGDGARLGDFKGRSGGLGPVLSYVLPRGDDTLVAELRWLHEIDTSNRLQGDFLWLKIVYQF